MIIINPATATIFQIEVCTSLFLLDFRAPSGFTQTNLRTEESVEFEIPKR